MSGGGFDRAVSDQLRTRLGITAERYRRLGAPIATPGELRKLRILLRLSCAQIAKELGCEVRHAQAWFLGVRPCRPRDEAVAARITQWVARARELDAFAAIDLPEPRRGFDARPATKPPKYERPPSNLEYRCQDCGQGSPGKSPLPWHKVRRAPEGGENWIHGRKRCGPVVAGGLAHKAAVLEQALGNGA